MKLEKILKKIQYRSINGIIGDVDVLDITRDSRNVKEGSLYMAVIGESNDGHKFIDSAIEKGAKVVIYSDNLDKFVDGVVYVRVEDVRRSMSEISKVFYHVDRCIKFIGVTGTNGKTTSAFMLKHLLESKGYKVGLIGTVANYICDKKIDAERTTPEPIELFRLIRDMKLAECDYCVMEVSSHASVLDRVLGIEFEIGGFTNLTQDHLDFHKTFDEYYKAKFKFIESSKNHIVNVDDAYGRNMIKDLARSGKYAWTYGVKNGMFQATNINLNASGSSFDLFIEGVDRGRVSIHIPGLYNVYNAMGVIVMLHSIGMGIQDMIDGFNTMRSVDGRCERVYHDKLKSTVVVDYAHTPDGLENILKTMKEVVKGRLITVFGCGGDRDRTKRSLMGKVASKYSDFSIVTSDNPRTENPSLIIKDILDGMSGAYIMLEQRKCAIEYAVQISGEDDIVVIAGKGHEDYQIIGTKKLHFSDKEIVVNFCENL